MREKNINLKSKKIFLQLFVIHFAIHLEYHIFKL